MEVPKEVWKLIRIKLRDAGYDHAIDNDEGTLDMHGIALVVQGGNVEDAKVQQKE
jgi:hypothetical protein